ncbi:ABC transporter substrate-binding protein [Tessaracoccus oleiagri]|uniref:Probable sugar-binding periplasmic protein n=1 Tax=Tessaracoccus oleiagri TaxID=686624 RepID=A0A1G9HLN2_9ACTN|nr:ABC transporter substrate-binding protein [Tessaracoccus oleiagri]SDL13860.1 raffinose/stachyose/melibiose transport system substrate-binding protein [Tessaracoccus oleiagri]
MNQLHRTGRPAGAVVLVAVALALGGCSTESPAQGSSGSPAPDGTSQTVLTFASGQQAAAQQLLDGFQEAHPEYRVEPVFIEQDSAYIQQIRTQLSAGTAPDIFKVWPGGGDSMAILSVAADGLVADLSGEEWADLVPENLRGLSGRDGALHSLPATIGGIGAIYNDQAMQELGATPPNTWDQVLELCADAQSAGKVAYALGNKDAWTAQLLPYALTATLVYGPDPEFTEKQIAGSATFADSGWSEALVKIGEMRAAQCFNEGANGTGYDDQMTLVARGDALGAVHVSQAVSGAQQYAPEGTTFSLAPFPATNNADETYTPVAPGLNFAMNAKAENPEAARAFLEYAASPEGQALFAVASNSTPALPAPEYEADAINQPLIAAQESKRATVYPDQTWPNTQVKEEFMISMQELFNGTLAPGEILERLDDAMQG